MKTREELIDIAIGEVVRNVINFPEKVQARLLGQDMGPLRKKLTDAVVTALAAGGVSPTAPDEREALAEVIARTMPGWNEDTSEVLHPGWSEEYRRHAELHWIRINDECLRQGRVYADAILAAGFRRSREATTEPQATCEWEYGIRYSGSLGDIAAYSTHAVALSNLNRRLGDELLRRRKAGPWIRVEAVEASRSPKPTERSKP